MAMAMAQSPSASISLPAMPVESAIAKKQQQKQQQQSSLNDSNYILFIALGIVIILTSLILLALLVILIHRKKKELRRSTQLCLPSTCTTKSIIPANPALQPQNQRHCSKSRSRSSKAASVARNPFQEFKYKEIQKATDDFSTIIGRGGYGTVYRARFSDGVVAAVKRMNSGGSSKQQVRRSRQLLQEFSKEMEFLSRLHHRHLVTLRGFCRKKGERFLVYEYMENGSLREHLQGGDQSKSPLSWKTRLQIAIDVASALEYLHCYCDPPLCHRDIKSSNILLDRNFTAKIADFGLVHATPATPPAAATADRRGSAVIMAMATTDVRGTPGYMDPEYVVTKKMTAKSDVYSYGVLLLELVSGRAAVQEMVNIVEWAEKQMKPRINERKHKSSDGYGGEASAAMEVESVVAMADPCLAHSISSSSAIAAEVKKVMNLAMMCTRKDSEKRPNMREIMRFLQQVVSIDYLLHQEQQQQQSSNKASIAMDPYIPNLSSSAFKTEASAAESAAAAAADDDDELSILQQQQKQKQHLMMMMMMTMNSFHSPSYLNLSDEISSLSSSPSPFYDLCIHGDSALPAPPPSATSGDLCVSFRFETTPPLSPDIMESNTRR